MHHPSKYNAKRDPLGPQVSHGGRETEVSKGLCCRPLNTGGPHQPAHPESLAGLTGEGLSLQRLEEVFLLQMHGHQHKATSITKNQGKLDAAKGTKIEP